MKFKNARSILAYIIVVTVMLNLLSIIQYASAAAPELPKNYCVECHRKLISTFDSQNKSNINVVDIRIKHIESGIACSIVCHEDKQNKSTSSTFAMWSISTHALFNVTCDSCHGGDPYAKLKDIAHLNMSKGEDSGILRANTPEMCGKCHKPELDEFKSSQHFKKLETVGGGPAPACITCHQAHSVRVLKPSEIEDFCSNCHNYVTGIDPSVPLRAQKALSSVYDLEVEFSKARSSIISAKAQGKDVADAEANLESTKIIMRNIPSVWHRFNLTYFETEVKRGIETAIKAEQATPDKTSGIPEKSPGFEVVLLIPGMIAVYLLKYVNKNK